MCSGCTRKSTFNGPKSYRAFSFRDSPLRGWQREREFRILQQSRTWYRNCSSWNQASQRCKDLLVGGLALLNPGKGTPDDGIFIPGHTVKSSDLGTAGEPDVLKDVYGEGVFFRDHFPLTPSINYSSRFLGLGAGTDLTPLQGEFNDLAGPIDKVGGIVGLTLSTALTIHFLVQSGTRDPRW